MNLLLLFPSDFIAPGQVRLTGRRFVHLNRILAVKPGDILCAGLAGGSMGRGIVRQVSDKEAVLDVSLTDSPPKKLPVILCAALMRPLVLKRVLLTAASLGVSEIILMNSSRVEKSFWQSSVLREEELQEQLQLGLEQSRDTIFPVVTRQERFRPFVEDVLPGLLQGRRGIVADPSGDSAFFKERVTGGVVLLVGPEGGFIPWELEQFRLAGCCIAGLGERILKVDTAIVTLLAKLFP